nr:putative lectin [uncultured Mediterranean phage uvMED]
MTKARDLANIISGGFTVADLPTLTASEIPNLDASKITSGSIADARIPASAVSQHASSFDDNKIVNDLSTLGLRVHTQENLNVSTSNSTSFDVFNDSTGIASFTTCSRDSNNEQVSTKIFGTSALIDFDDIDGSGTDVEYKTSGNTSNHGPDNNTSFIGINDNGSSNHQSIDTKYWLDNSWSGTGGHFGFANAVPRDSTDRTNYFHIFDFKAVYQFGGVWYWGKQNGYGDMRKFQLQSSLDDSTYSNIDLSGATRTSTVRSNGSPSGSEGQFTSGASDGTFLLNQHASEYYSTANTLGNFPTTEMRYLKIILMNQHTGSSNTNAGYTFNMTKQPVSFSATGNFVGTNITAPSSVSKMGAVITYKETGTNTLNTDIVLQLSADGGSNYSTATLTALPDFATGIKMAKVNDLSVTAGTSLNYKISFANQNDGVKVAKIKGVSLQY